MNRAILLASTAIGPVLIPAPFDDWSLNFRNEGLTLFDLDSGYVSVSVDYDPGSGLPFSDYYGDPSARPERFKGLTYHARVPTAAEVRATIRGRPDWATASWRDLAERERIRRGRASDQIPRVICPA